MPSRIIVVGAHPDDVESAFGGTVAKLAQRDWEVIIAVPTLSRESSTGTSTVPERSFTDELRMSEAREAANRIGVDFVEIQGRYHSPTDGVEQVSHLVDFVRLHRPTAIFSNCTADAHPTHRRISGLLSQAIFYAASPSYSSTSEPHATSVYAQYCAYSCVGACLPTHFIDVTEQIGVAERALSCHCEGLALVPGLKAWARARRLMCGAKYGVPYAESFRAFKGGVFGFKPNVRALESLWWSLEKGLDP